MFKKTSISFKDFLSLLFIILFGIFGTANAQRRNAGDGDKKLPPMHYVRSREYDMQHIALNLKFDWDKEQAYGTATITLAPLVPKFSKGQSRCGVNDNQFGQNERERFNIQI